MIPRASVSAVAELRENRLGDGRRQVVFERFARPATFNSLRIQPSYGKGAAARMAAGAFRMKDEIETWRTAAVELAATDHGVAPLVGQWAVSVSHLRIDRRWIPDVGAPFVAVKAVLDGLADGGLLPHGDGPDVVRILMFHPPQFVGCDGLRIVLTAVADTEQTALDLTEGTTAP